MASRKDEFKASHTEQELSEDKTFFHCSYIRVDMINFSELLDLEKKTVKKEVFLCEDI